jgi:hypothetical protein
MTEHATNPSCATCHRLIDPIGFGLEKFDAVGARRENLVLEFGGFDEEGRPRGPVKTVALDIDSTGNVAGIPDSRFSSPAQLGSVLAKSGQCQECVVKQYFRYTVGREDTPADRPLIRKAFEEFRNSQFRFQQLIVSITLLREFPDREEAAHAADNYKSR